MPPGTRSEKNEDTGTIINFLKSSEFNEMIRGIVSKETKMLNKTISALKTEMEILRQSNIELIKLLTANKCDVNQTCATQQVVNVEDSCKTPTNETFEVNKSVSYAEKLRVNKENLSEENKTKFLSQEKDVKGKTIQEDWNVISKKQKQPKKKNNTVYGTVENTLIKGVTRYSHFHICKLQPSTCAEDVVKYLESKNICDVKCEKIVSRFPNEYSSFKVSVPFKYKEEITKAELWPQDVGINPFLHRLVKPNSKS